MPSEFEPIKKQTIEVAEKLTKLGETLEAQEKETIAQLNEELKKISQRIDSAFTKGELKKYQYSDLKNDISSLAHALHALSEQGKSEPWFTSEVASTKINERAEKLEKAPYTPGNFPSAMTRLNIYLLNERNFDEGTQYQSLNLPLSPDETQQFSFLSSLTGSSEKESHFTEITFIKPPLKKDSVVGAILRAKTSLGEIGTFTFGKTEAECFITKPDGTTEKVKFKIDQRDYFPDAFIEETQEMPKAKVAIRKNELVFTEVPLAFDAKKKFPEITFDLKLPKGVVARVVDDAYVIIEDTEGIGFSWDGVTTPYGSKICIYLKEIKKNRDGTLSEIFQCDIGGDREEYAGNIEEYIAEKVISLHFKEAEEAGEKIQKIGKEKVRCLGPDRLGRYAVLGPNENRLLFIDPKTKHIDFTPTRKQFKIIPHNELPKNLTKAAAYLKKHPHAILSMYVRGKDKYYEIITLGDFKTYGAEIQMHSPNSPSE